MLVCAIDYGVGNPELGLKGPQALMRIVETQKRTIQLSRYLELSDWFSRLRVRDALPSVSCEAGNVEFSYWKKSCVDKA